MTIKFNTNEVAIVGDLHLGNSLNSEKYHKIAIDYSNWLSKTLKSKDIRDIIFLGDIFHNREEIGTRTLQVAHDFFDNLKDFNIVIILGNHDIFYHDTTDVSSVSIFRGWSNITVVNKTQTISYGEKTLCFAPWGFKNEDIPPCDYLFGHFEISSFKLNLYRICEHGTNLGDLWEKSPLVFSGHFHCRQERESNGKKMIYVGSCYEQNWGEMDNNKGIYLLDINNSNHPFIKNDSSPIHIKANISDILKSKDVFLDFVKLVKGNFIKIIVDQETDVDKVEKIITKISQLNPLDFGTEFLIDSQSNNIEVTEKSVDLDMKTLIEQYIENIECKVDKNKLLVEIMKIYHTCDMEVQ